MVEDMSRQSWSAIVLVAAAVVVIAFSGYLLATWPPEPPGAAPPATSPASAEQTRAASPSPSEAETKPKPAPKPKPVVAVLGDSYSVEHPASTGPEWPRMLGEAFEVEVHTEAVDDGGYVSSGAGRPFGARVPDVLDHEADVIIVAGGVDDVGAWPTSQITIAADDVISRLVEGAPDAQVVVLSPFSNGPPGPLTNEFDTSLVQITERLRLPYVDATEWLTESGGFFAPDGQHPNDKGQRVLAERMEQELVELGLLEPPGTPES
jgi:lysophospholipase L1-like esterase